MENKCQFCGTENGSPLLWQNSQIVSCPQCLYAIKRYGLSYVRQVNALANQKEKSNDPHWGHSPIPAKRIKRTDNRPAVSLRSWLGIAEVFHDIDRYHLDKKHATFEGRRVSVYRCNGLTRIDVLDKV